MAMTKMPSEGAVVIPENVHGEFLLTYLTVQLSYANLLESFTAFSQNRPFVSWVNILPLFVE